MTASANELSTLATASAACVQQWRDGDLCRPRYCRPAGPAHAQPHRSAISGTTATADLPTSGGQHFGSRLLGPEPQWRPRPPERDWLIGPYSLTLTTTARIAANRARRATPTPIRFSNLGPGPTSSADCTPGWSMTTVPPLSRARAGRRSRGPISALHANSIAGTVFHRHQRRRFPVNKPPLAAGRSSRQQRQQVSTRAADDDLRRQRQLPLPTSDPALPCSRAPAGWTQTSSPRHVNLASAQHR